MWCINKEAKPVTCLCGCSLVSGIITVAVITGLSLVVEIATLNWRGVLFCLLDAVPLVCIWIRNDQRWARTYAFVWQCLLFALLCISLLLTAIFFHFVIDMACSDASTIASSKNTETQLKSDVCGQRLLGIFWITWSLLAAILVPLQWLFLTIFKAYREELVEPTDYQPVQQDESVETMA